MINTFKKEITENTYVQTKLRIRLATYALAMYLGDNPDMSREEYLELVDGLDTSVSTDRSHVDSFFKQYETPIKEGSSYSWVLKHPELDKLLGFYRSENLFKVGQYPLQ